MSELISLLGKISGRVGDLVFVQRGNTTFIKKRPGKRSTPYTAKELAHHRRFGFICKLASKIGEIKELKYFWKPERWSNRSSCNKICKENFKFINNETLEGPIQVVPQFGFNIGGYKGKITKTGFEIEYEPLEKGRNDFGKTTKYIIGGGVIVLKKPTHKKYPEYSIISFKSDKILFDPRKTIKIAIEIKDGDDSLLKEYTDKKVYISLITLDRKETPINYSSTINL
ncbi:MAG: hypothetical protein P4L35_01745 [Ignavibacteriaceae bacterium]|nr:hypothetical protein [Ignavibacteriaceae bacterium]